MCYRILEMILWAVFSAFYRIKVEGIENIPLTKPVIIAANHCSHLDPPVLGAALPRKVYYLAKSELWHSSLLGTLINQLGAIPVTRGRADVKSFRICTQILRGTGALVVFPEGQRSPDGTLQPPQAGLGRLVRNTQCWVVPTGVLGTHEIWPQGQRLPKARGRITVRFAPALPPSVWQSCQNDRTGDQEVVERVMNEIANIGGFDFPITNQNTSGSISKEGKIVTAPNS